MIQAMAKARNKRKRKERPQRIYTSRDCCMFRIISSLGYEEKIPTQWPLCIVVWSKNFTIRLCEIHARTHTHIHTSTFTLVVLYSHLLEWVFHNILEMRSIDCKIQHFYRLLRRWLNHHFKIIIYISFIHFRTKFGWSKMILNPKENCVKE